MMFANVSELYSLIKFKYFIKSPPVPEQEDLRYCYEVLTTVSRSFAAVIQELPQELRDPVCVFYLVLRALDTVEDDTKYPIDKKVPLLLNFYQEIEDETFVVQDCGDNTYKHLLENFPKVVRVYKSLEDKYRKVIKDITKEMGYGMAEFINQKNVDSLHDYNLYCYYVAGLVGIGLSQMFVQSGLESTELLDPKAADVYATISNQMGLFLQKTNIIRDYHEDIVEDRIFWPKQVWSKYADMLEDYKEEKNIPNGVKCLNELVTEAMDQIPACIQYMKLLKDQQIFNFCAIPQVMAIATMAEIYNNSNVFRRNVKIRKGMAAKLILNTKTVADVERTFYDFAEQIEAKINSNDPNAALTKKKVQEIKQMCSASQKQGSRALRLFALSSITGVTTFVLYKYKDVLLNKIFKK